jgi:hypothetical protein
MNLRFACKYHFWMISDRRQRLYAAQYDHGLLGLAKEVELNWANQFAQAAIAAMALEADDAQQALIEAQLKTAAPFGPTFKQEVRSGAGCMMDRLQFMRDERKKACNRLSGDRLQDALDQFDHYLIGALSSSPLMHDEEWQQAVTVACQCVAEDFQPASSQQPGASS